MKLISCSIPIVLKAIFPFCPLTPATSWCSRIFCPDGGKECYLLVLPDVLWKEVSMQLHQQHGHQGVECTSELIRQWCYWPNMLADITCWCQECECCQLAKDNRPVARAFMGHLLASKSNEVLAIDITVLESSYSRQENILVMTNVFSKFSMAVPICDQRAENVNKFWLRSGFISFGYWAVFIQTRAVALNLLLFRSFVSFIR